MNGTWEEEGKISKEVEAVYLVEEEDGVNRKCMERLAMKRSRNS